MKKTLIISASAIAILIYACNNSEKKVESKTESIFSDPIITNIDSSIAPGENFFLYANNGWFKKHPIPSSEKSNGIFQTIQDTINESIRKICESSATDSKAKKGSNKQKIGDLYFSGMDSSNIEKTNFSPLNEELARIEAIKNTTDLLATVSHLYTMDVKTMFGFSVSRDDKNSAKYVVSLGQARLGLPERDYYFNSDARTTNIRKEYVAHIQKIFELTGTETTLAKKNSTIVMSIESMLAKASRKMEDLRDPYKNYNKMSVTSFNKTNPSINWTETLAQLGLKNIDSVVVGQPEFFTQLESTIKKVNLNDWKAYLRWTLLNNYANTMNKKIEDQNFYFYSTVLDGIKEQKPRWKRIVNFTDATLGELVGQIYVEEYLPKGTKEKLLEIGNNIRDIYAEHIKNLDWMSDATKQKALSKLNKIVMKVGYPDKWKDMSSLEISRNSYLQNEINIDKWEYNFMISKYGKPVDLTEWDMYPQTYNAYYNPASNEIVVPACNIIVPGFEGRMPDDAILYGIIGGSTFGHEITHGFDDQGSLYDENGNLKDWWTKEDREKFVTKTKLIVEQFNNYTVLDSIHVRGENTQGENIADLGGVIMGYEAFKKTKQGQSTELINGYTADQRYFLAYGYAWMVNRTDASLAKQIMSDVHSPAEFRINGPLSDNDAFYKAFHIKKGDKMYREENIRVKIW
ncbi:MAG: M13 family metallopeptidase [Bacteroidetes bacterium]|nr:M13 family metallopeptidase [Bacteroidota bacterium]